MTTYTEEYKVKPKISLECAVDAFAGLMVLLSVMLTWFVHAGFIGLTIFVGANLFQQAFTGICPAATILQKVFGFRPACDL
jgi:hypothetical protein